ncbi:solute carrier family 22 member 21 [Plakobranchus ocellatus]|uniref:Solute carrier family 22 member 21 n=1 Tax=Plakobranchus ocellatus TaxID=259542 RepID=A0AAV4AXE1_9GAST|nr:solute carrier family 22 member 21 [Plakobranchus ocellatus]
MALEQVYEDIGGLSWFQYRIIVVISLVKALTGWSMMMMAFAGLVPKFRCVVEEEELQDYPVTVSNFTNHSFPLDKCSVNGTVCTTYQFLSDARSAVTEWDLVCDLKWVKPTITSIQMAGVLVGAVLAGQSGDMFGRRGTNFGFFLVHTVFNVIAGFSTSWQMFIALRFLIGFCIGGQLVVLVPYLTEFLPIRWRPLVSAVPMWPLGVVLFAGAAWLLEDWSHLHFGCAVLSAPVLLAYFIIPESPRWLAVQGKLKEAHSVVEKMATVNGRSVPPYTMEVIEEISLEAANSRKGGKKYSYLDIFNSFSIAKITLIFGFQWCAISIVFYGLSFGVASFSGNLYLNIALMALVELPAYFATFFFVNTIGRRLTTFGYFVIGCAAAFACVIVHYKVSGSARGTAISVLSLLAKMASSGCWGSTATWVVENYPTVTRSVGYGFVNMTARIGAIIAPFALDLDYNFAASYITVGVLQVVCLFLTLLLPETMGKSLPDNVDTGNHGNAENGHTNGFVNEDLDLHVGLGNGTANEKLDVKIDTLEV